MTASTTSSTSITSESEFGGERDGTAGHLQSEYMVPRTNATAAIAQLRSIGDRIDGHLSTSAIRSIAAAHCGSALSMGTTALAYIFRGGESLMQCKRSPPRSRKCCCRLVRPHRV